MNIFWEWTAGSRCARLAARPVLELKRRGIGYVLLLEGAVNAADFEANPALWGVREVGRSNGARLYQLQ